MGEAPGVDPLEAAEVQADGMVWSTVYAAALPLIRVEDDYNAAAVQMADDALRAWRQRSERGL